METIKNLEIIALVEDTSPKRPFRGEHGLSFWIEADNRKILFDTGYSGEILNYNLNAFGLTLKELDAFVLSHLHDDHSGGIGSIIDKIKNVPMYCISNFFDKYIPNGKEISTKISDITYVENNLKLFPGVYIPKQRNTVNSPSPTKEINLVINLERKGLVIIVGCAHHGLDNIITDAKSIFENKIPVYAVLGGFHLKDENEKKIIDTINFFKKSGVKILAPNHCTGFNALRIMTQNFPEEMKLVSKTDTGTFHTGMKIKL